MLDPTDPVTTDTFYVGSKFCRVCFRNLTPLEVAYNGDICTPDKKYEQRRLLMNKRVSL